ncbi:hypothetical protein COCSUDRAFT_37112 [Coccomyxa subellipsoidea C-169]|uniref:Uncharacterized protein n=1 Tax=Coccomyxa subellipsoidea (strain C-169) TaxID=574566 RepID=I0YTN5_COCSC|nr:hypothetical protein COCSUDRAFT_37112 [Coccomyxa subellipsoidea C-169]EIE21754.1 hypothetical protein COCSUDRAFT_37112 [Coccomyxa subellipsoidea C-169]|eukprot:XP_005646298.1 hypothetical protein COCSUDRAFT_37112 [Coccomyxa subellipsoidea C-169]
MTAFQPSVSWAFLRQVRDKLWHDLRSAMLSTLPYRIEIEIRLIMKADRMPVQDPFDRKLL